VKRTLTRLAGLAAVLAVSSVAILAPAQASTIAHSASLPTLTLTMSGNGSSIALSGAPAAGAVNLDSVVKSSHGAAPILVHLNPGVSFAQALAAVGRAHGDPNALQGLAQITFAIGYQGPGAYSAQTVLTPGEWVALDTTKNDPSKWPTASFTVSAVGQAQSLPRPGATVKAIEFKFTGPTTWHRGETIRFVNGGYLAHMIVGAKFKDAAAARRGMALLKAGKDAAAEKSAIGFTSFQETVSPGATQQEKITASPGVYVVACFMTTQDGREHTRLGMETVVTITG
jgi:hypothetical protein